MLMRRLQACADMITKGNIVCDVGTDHAYLAVELLKQNKCNHVIASDIGEGPLQAAEKTLVHAGLKNKATLLLCDGLQAVPQKDVTDVVIAGMGGETIVHILSNCKWIKNNVNLILQPMTKASVLRQWLSENGYNILQEKVVRETKFYYTVLKAVYDGKEHNYTQLQLALGVIDWKEKISLEYGKFRLAQWEKLAEQLKQSNQVLEEKYKILISELKEKIIF